MTVPASKIEDRAIGALEQIINDHPTMSCDINKHDKEMCWDGYIKIFNSLETQSKKTFDDRIPIQIKGHINQELATTKNRQIKYAVSLDDLNVFFKDRGVLYFQIFLSESGKENQIFYASLFGSKLKHYIESAEEKGNCSSTTIVFNRLSNDSDELYSIAKQFSIESKSQGSGEGQIVPRTVPFDELKDSSDVTLLLGGVKNSNEFFRRLSSGDFCFYTTLQCGIKVPIEWTDHFNVVYEAEINKPVSIGNRIFYNCFKLAKDTDGNETIILSDNLSLKTKDNQVCFRLRTSFRQLRKDSEFLLEAASTTNPILIGSTSFYRNGIMEDEFISLLNHIIDIDDVLKMIEFEFIPSGDGITKEIFDQLSKLVSIKNGEYNDKLAHQYNLYDWKISDKYMPIMIYRLMDEDKIELRNAVFTKSHQMFISDSDRNCYVVPSFYALKNSVFSNMYYYDYESLKAQIDMEDVAEYTLDALTDCVIKLLNAFDFNGDFKLLELAKYQMDRIENLAKDDPSFFVNGKQIKFREGIFDDEDKKTVQNMKAEDNITLFCKYVLLGNFEYAEAHYNLLSEEEKTIIDEWPIMYLYHDLKISCNH